MSAALTLIDCYEIIPNTPLVDVAFNDRLLKLSWLHFSAWIDSGSGGTTR